MAEALGTVHIRGWGLIRGWWWPVSPKLLFDQMAAPIPEIMGGSLYIEGIGEIREWRDGESGDGRVRYESFMIRNHY
jgi:hypothetical protein